MARDRTDLTVPPTNCPLKIRGIETQRRDGVVWTREVMTDIQHALCHGDPESAFDIFKGAVKDLLHNDVDYTKLVTSKALSKAEYKNGNIPHVFLVNHWQRHDRPQASAPRVGDRVPYVITEGPGQLYLRAEDPQYALAHNIKLDVLHYMDQLAPAARMLELDFEDPETVIKDAHRELDNKKRKNQSITQFFKPAPAPANKSLKT